MDKYNEVFSDVDNIKQHTERIVADTDLIKKSISAYNALIKEIDNIATKINLIAINASIEASRAGANGATFKIISEEIRGLADDSHNAADSTRAVSQSDEETLTHLISEIAIISENVSDVH